MNDIRQKDFEQLVRLLGRDMERLRKDMVTLSNNQLVLLDEFRKLAEVIGHKVQVLTNQGGEDD